MSINEPQISCSRAGVQLSPPLIWRLQFITSVRQLRLVPDGRRNALTGTEAEEAPDMQKMEQKSNNETRKG